jgi:hypothetical protein
VCSPDVSATPAGLPKNLCISLDRSVVGCFSSNRAIAAESGFIGTAVNRIAKRIL